MNQVVRSVLKEYEGQRVDIFAATEIMIKILKKAKNDSYLRKNHFDFESSPHDNSLERMLLLNDDGKVFMQLPYPKKLGKLYVGGQNSQRIAESFVKALRWLKDQLAKDHQHPEEYYSYSLGFYIYFENEISPHFCIFQLSGNPVVLYEKNGAFGHPLFGTTEGEEMFLSLDYLYPDSSNPYRLYIPKNPFIEWFEDVLFEISLEP